MATKLTVDIGAIQLFLGDSGYGSKAPRIALARFGKADVRVYAKQMEPARLAAELFGALLARTAGFRAPHPGLAFDETTGLWWFTSRQRAAPDLSRRFSIGQVPGPAQREAFAAAAAWITSRRQFPAMVAWDEWINNRDRNLQNLLVEGDDFSLIDHEQAFDCHDDERADVNKMAQLVNATLDPIAQMRVKSGAVAGAMTFSPDWTRLVHDILSPLPAKAVKNVGIIRHWTEARYPSTIQRVERRIAGGQSNLAL